jgi:hypothetical protein
VQRVRAGVAVARKVEALQAAREAGRAEEKKNREKRAVQRGEERVAKAGAPKTISEMAAARKKLSDTWQDKRVAARNAEIESDRVSKLTKGDNSPEARAQRLKAATAADKAQQARDRAQRAWMKMNDKLDAAMERQPAKKGESQAGK